MPPTAPNFYTLLYQAEPLLLRGTVLRPLTTCEFTESCELLLAWAQHYHCPFWLIDGRADIVQPFDIYEWAQDEFLPRVYHALGRVPCVAFVGKPELWLTLQANNYAPLAPITRSAAARTNWFTNEAEALAWLVQFRPAFGRP